ncbi:hypothetical protein SpCBS45565_g00369 [Spizellomyces sp. 'palustris']|nr:hypothetical protein SpCBS45565_g00369 [Spizellomyces sp. 'palustris']
MTANATSESLDVHLDSLPYIDGEISPELSDQIASLVSHPPPSTLHPSLVPTPYDTPPEAPPKIQTFDTTRLRLDTPSESTVEAYKLAVENACAQLEHQNTRMVNLELVHTFGSNAWKLHCFQLEYLKKKVDVQVEQIKKEVLEVNRERKMGQMKTGQTLQTLTYKYSQLLNQTIQVDSATRQLQQEVDHLQAVCAQLEADTSINGE